jgi:hypothetical protein
MKNGEGMTGTHKIGIFFRAVIFISDSGRDTSAVLCGCNSVLKLGTG